MASRLKRSIISRTSRTLGSVGTSLHLRHASPDPATAPPTQHQQQQQTPAQQQAARVIRYTGFVLVYEIDNGVTDLRRRWAVIRDLCLYLYRRRSEKECYMAIILPGSSVTWQPKRGKYQVIVIQEYNGQKVRFLPEDPKDFDEWFSILKAACSMEALEQQFSARGNLSARQQQAGPRSAVSHDDLFSPRDSPSLPGEDRVYKLHNQGEHFDTNLASHHHNFHQRDSPLVGENPLEAKYAVATRTGPSLPPVPHTEESFPLVPSSSDPDLHQSEQQKHVSRHSQTSQPSNKIRSASVFPRMETLMEDESLRDGEIERTIPLSEISRRYPVSGLAKRMSISAGDLLGRSRDELVLLLIQLNREKANLKRWKKYHEVWIEAAVERVQEQEERDEEEVRQVQSELEEHREALLDVEYQIELSLPLIHFLDNIIKMGGVFAGDDLMFMTEYRKSILGVEQMRPAKENLHFLRSVQEREIAQDLTEKLPDAENQSVNIYYEAPAGNAAVYENLPVSDPTPHRKYDSIAVDMTPERLQQFHKTKEQLELELQELEAIMMQRFQQQQVHDLHTYIDDLNANGLKPPDLQSKVQHGCTPSSKPRWLKEHDPGPYHSGDERHTRFSPSASPGHSSHGDGGYDSRRRANSDSISNEPVSTHFSNSSASPARCRDPQDTSKYPRRSTKHLKRSDIANCARRREECPADAGLPSPRPVPNQFVRKWSLPAAKAAELRWSKRFPPGSENNGDIPSEADFGRHGATEEQPTEAPELPSERDYYQELEDVVAGLHMEPHGHGRPQSLNY